MQMHISRALSIVIAAALWASSPVIAEQCPAGSVTTNAQTGNIDVTYSVGLDDQGNPVVLSDTFVPSTKFQATVTEADSYDPATGLYTYTYTVANSAASQQQVYEVLLAVPGNAPVSDHQTSAGTPPWILLASVPMTGGFGWRHSLAAEPFDEAVVGIPQGTSITFSFRSPFLPGPVDAYLCGDSPIPAFQTELPDCVDELVGHYEAFPGAYVKYGTTGPKTAP